MAKKLNFNSPPVMRDDLTYKEWRADLEIWSDFTELDAVKKGGAVFLTLTGKAQQTVRASVSRDKLKAQDGLNAVLVCLDKLYLKDETSSGFAAFEDFVSYRRPSDTSIQDFLIEFNLKQSRCASHKLKLPDGVLAYYLLKCANLSDEQANICKATCGSLTLADMQKQIERITSTAGRPDKSNSDSQNVTVHPQYYSVEDEEDYCYVEDSFDYGVNAEGEDEGNSCEAYYAQPSQHQNPNYRSNMPRRRVSWTRQPQGAQGTSLPRLNTPDEYGNPTRCSFCRSTYHYVGNCPDAAKHTAARGRGTPIYRRAGGRGRAARGRGGQPYI